MKKERIVAILIAYIVIAVLAFLATSALIEYFKTKDYIEADVVRVVEDSIIIGHGCRALVAGTSPERARSIQLGLEGRIETRPNTHDTFAQVLQHFNITLEAVLIDDLVNDTYNAKMVLHRGDEVLKLDTRPSDGIAVAVRTNTTIYIKNELLEATGRDIC